MAQAAAIASALEGRVPNVGKAGEDSAVKAALTIADTAAQEALLVPLLGAFRDVRLEAEEDTRSVALFTGRDARRVVIDPIDGTLHFYLGARGPYAVMAGLALHDRYEAALVALPREGWLFDAVRNEGARRRQLQDGAIESLARAAGGDAVLLTDGVPERVAERLRASGFDVRRACGGAVAIAPLLPGVRGGIRVATETISTRGRIGLLIATEAGAIVETGTGEPFPAAIDAPVASLVVASEPAVARELGAALDAG